MTHAFFKALLFMGAGSIISAMGGEQSLDKMSGFRRALPFTFASFILGGLALAGMPPFSGWLSKDNIIGYLLNRGGLFAVLGILGYVGALLTGIYTFRMIFRAFLGDPCVEAAELEQGHLHHPESGFNPNNGELEDTDVGFPGPDHNIAERNWTMKFPMATLGVLALVGGAVEIPGVDDVITKFLRPTFATSRLYAMDPSTGRAWLGLVIGALIAVAGIGIAFVVYIREPGASARLEERLPALHTFLYNKWYFDELIDFIVVRPTQMTGRFAQTVLDGQLIAGGVTGSGTGIVRAASATVRRAQTGFLRYYAALMLVGVGAIALYFLIAST
jgi:NADH-quinone oxidoreductase subunit L